MVQPRDLGQVQADEIRAKLQGGIQWIAMVIMVPTRLWLGGAISASRDRQLIRRLVAIIRACALPRPLLLAVDGLSTYVKAFRQAFRSPKLTGQVGRPKEIPWPDVVIGQVVKQYKQRRVVKVVRRIVQGSQELLQKLLGLTPGQNVLNTAYIERLNGTFRARLAALARRTRSLLRREAMLQAGMYLVGTVQLLYFSCQPLATRTAAYSGHGRRHYRSSLEYGRIALASGSSTTLETAKTPRAALQGDESAGGTMGELTKFKRTATASEGVS